MKKHARFLSGALALILVSSSTSYAWNGRGHMDGGSISMLAVQIG